MEFWWCQIKLSCRIDCQTQHFWLMGLQTLAFKLATVLIPLSPLSLSSQHKPSEEPPIDVVPSTTTVESSSKKKFVFRIRTAQGAEFLLQADDAPSFSNWVTAIQRLNIGQNVPNDPFSSAMTRPESSNKLAPNSPLMQRRSSSPQPQKTGGKRKGECSGVKYMYGNRTSQGMENCTCI